jgi:hypothetical protein
MTRLDHMIKRNMRMHKFLDPQELAYSNCRNPDKQLCKDLKIRCNNECLKLNGAAHEEWFKVFNKPLVNDKKN